jgi:hypothetical protein
MFDYRAHFTDDKPHMVEPLPQIAHSKCDCAFCILLFGMPAEDLTSGDMKLWKEHLRQKHGLRDEITA